MKTTFISKENNEVRFEMEFNGEEFEDAIIKVYKENKDKFQVDGFRKGKAPRSIIEKKYGEHIFEDDAVNDLFASGYVEAIAELGLEVINSPRAEFKDIKRDEGFKVTVTVEVYPVVDVHDYKGVEIEKVDMKYMMKMLMKLSEACRREMQEWKMSTEQYNAVII